MADEIEKKLVNDQWLGGQLPSSADREAFESLSAPPSPATHPNAFAWWCLVAKFMPAVRASWTGAAAAPAKGGAKKAEAPAKTEAKPAKKDDDEFDPFADEGEEDKAAAEALKAKAAEEKGKKAKAAPVAKSIIVWEVKPWGEETDLDALAAKILGITMEGLSWKTEYKKEPIAYGVFKIVIGAVVEDAKVSTDEVAEIIEGFEDEVQSVDIQSFNKLWADTPTLIT